jgi:dihydrofolate synthase/folylpolyglutamate synthase
MAALYFAEQNCDYVVLETGLGGRLDATSVVTPEVCIITSIGMDHMQYLGNTIEEIAGEKAGIIVPGVPVIYNTGSYVADKVIEEKAGKLVSPAYNVVKYKDGVLKLLGEESTAGFKALYQIDNAVTATLAFMMMQEKDELDVTDMKKALAKFSWPGRMQYLAPNIIMDGAHNEDAIKRFVESVKSIAERDGWKKMSLLFAVSSDKDYEDIISILTRELTFEDIYVGELASDRKLDASKVVELFQKYSTAEKHFSIVGTKNIEDAWRLATGELEEDTLLLIVGSLYMVGEIEKLIGKE